MDKKTASEHLHKGLFAYFSTL